MFLNLEGGLPIIVNRYFSSILKEDNHQSKKFKMKAFIIFVGFH